MKGAQHTRKESRDLTEPSASATTDSLSRAIAKVHGYNNGGHEYYRMNDFHQAFMFYERALQWAHRAEKLVPSPSVVPVDDESTSTNTETATLVPMTLVNLGEAHLVRDECEKAIACYRQAISHLQREPLCLKQNHPDVLRIEHKVEEVKRVRQELSAACSTLQLHAKRMEMSGHYKEALRSHNTTLTMLTGAVGTMHPNVAQTLQKIGLLNWKLGNYTSALDALSDSLRTTLQCLGQDHIDSAETLTTIGMVHTARGDYDAAMKFYEVALRIRKENLGECHPDVARVLLRIGMVFDESGLNERAMKLFKDGLRIQRNALASLEEAINNCESTADSACVENNKDAHLSLILDIAATLNSKGVVHEKCREFATAKAAYEEALSLYRRALGGDDHVDVSVTLNNIGQIYRHMGRHKKAMITYQRALKAMKACLGNSHRNVAATKHNIGLVYAEQGDFDKALELYKSVLDIQRKALGDEHLDVALTLDSMGHIYEMRGDLCPKGREKGKECPRHSKYIKAGHFYKKALRIRRKTLGAHHLFIALTVHKLGTFHFAKESDNKEALRRFKEAVRIYRLNHVGEGDPRLVDVLRCMGTANTELRKIPDLSLRTALSSKSMQSTASSYDSSRREGSQ